jgi:hypothetical protein
MFLFFQSDLGLLLRFIRRTYFLWGLGLKVQVLRFRWISWWVEWCPWRSWAFEKKITFGGMFFVLAGIIVVDTFLFMCVCQRPKVRQY